MSLDNLFPHPGSRRQARRLGRGPGSGSGKTAARGHKGQKSRAGGGVKPGFEGGQMPLTRRLPKRGFTNKVFKKEWLIVNLRDLHRFPADSVVDEKALRQAGLVKGQVKNIKLLGLGEVTNALTVRLPAVSAQARKRLEAAGGRVEVL